MPQNNKSRAKDIINHLLQNDPFSRWLGIELLTCDAGYAKIKMTVREEMLNGFGVGHGGITYAFADSCLAFASNSHGRLSLALDVNITYPAPVDCGDILIAEANEESLTYRTGVYSIRVEKSDQTLVALFRGTVYRTSKTHLDEEFGKNK